MLQFTSAKALLKNHKRTRHFNPNKFERLSSYSYDIISSFLGFEDLLFQSYTSLLFKMKFLSYVNIDSDMYQYIFQYFCFYYRLSKEAERSDYLNVFFTLNICDVNLRLKTLRDKTKIPYIKRKALGFFLSIQLHKTRLRTFLISIDNYYQYELYYNLLKEIDIEGIVFHLDIPFYCDNYLAMIPLFSNVLCCNKIVFVNDESKRRYCYMQDLMFEYKFDRKVIDVLYLTKANSKTVKNYLEASSNVILREISIDKDTMSSDEETVETYHWIIQEFKKTMRGISLNGEGQEKEIMKMMTKDMKNLKEIKLADYLKEKEDSNKIIKDIIKVGGLCKEIEKIDNIIIKTERNAKDIAKTISNSFSKLIHISLIIPAVKISTALEIIKSFFKEYTLYTLQSLTITTHNTLNGNLLPLLPKFTKLTNYKEITINHSQSDNIITINDNLIISLSPNQKTIPSILPIIINNYSQYNHCSLYFNGTIPSKDLQKSLYDLLIKKKPILFNSINSPSLFNLISDKITSVSHIDFTKSKDESEYELYSSIKHSYIIDVYSDQIDNNPLIRKIINNNNPICLIYRSESTLLKKDYDFLKTLSQLKYLLLNHRNTEVDYISTIHLNLPTVQVFGIKTPT